MRGSDCMRDSSSGSMEKQVEDRQEAGILARELSQIFGQELVIEHGPG